MDDFTLHPIGVVHSCFKGKFGIPRQPGLIPDAPGEIEFVPPYNQQNVVRGLETFSHIWVMFVFHLSIREHWKSTVRPPRLGGDTRVGVFATRSPFRPNPVGLSVVKLEEIIVKPGQLRLKVSGLDILDGSPVLDIKPYLPFVDSVPQANGGFASVPPNTQALEVEFLPECREALANEALRHPGYEDLARRMISADPRPAYQNIPGKEYDIFLYDTELAFYCRDGRASVFRISRDSHHGSSAETLER